MGDLSEDTRKMSEKFKVSQSKVNTWLRCHLASYYKYVKKLAKKKKARPLVFGTIVHEMVEANANSDNPFDKLKEIDKQQGAMFASEREEYGNLIEDVTNIMTDYFDFWPEKSMRFIRHNKKAAEHVFEVDIGDDIVATGKLDAIGVTPNKLRWLVEHKSGRNLPNEDHRWRNLQSNLYIKIMEIIGLKPVDGTCWDYIRSKPPTKPQLKKDGTLSTRKLDTLPSAVKVAFKEHGISLNNPAAKAILEEAIANRRNYFQRIFTPAKPRIMEKVFKEFFEAARDMRDNLGKKTFRHFGRHCEWCEYEGLCRAELTGGDVDFLIAKDYTTIKKSADYEPDFEA